MAGYSRTPWRLNIEARFHTLKSVSLLGCRRSQRRQNIEPATPLTQRPAQWREDKEFQAALLTPQDSSGDILVAKAHRGTTEGTEEPVGWFYGIPAGWFTHLAQDGEEELRRQDVRISGTLCRATVGDRDRGRGSSPFCDVGPSHNPRLRLATASLRTRRLAQGPQPRREGMPGVVLQIERQVECCDDVRLGLPWRRVLGPARPSVRIQPIVQNRFASAKM